MEVQLDFVYDAIDAMGLGPMPLGFAPFKPTRPTTKK
jgi:hypothetical protein